MNQLARLALEETRYGSGTCLIFNTFLLLHLFFAGEPYRLIINNVSAIDSGRYGCKAANAVSYSISEESVSIECEYQSNQSL